MPPGAVPSTPSRARRSSSTVPSPAAATLEGAEMSPTSYWTRPRGFSDQPSVEPIRGTPVKRWFPDACARAGAAVIVSSAAGIASANPARPPIMKPSAFESGGNYEGCVTRPRQRDDGSVTFARGR